MLQIIAEAEAYMEEQQDNRDDKAKEKKKGFWGALVEKIDKLMLDKANQSCCKDGSKDGKCC